MRVYIIATVVFLAFYGAFAQDLERSVDVVKEYAPLVERAEKLPVEVKNLDAGAEIAPDFDYDVSSRVWVSQFETAPISAAWVLPEGFAQRRAQFYAKLGGGYPDNSLADVYLTARNFGIYGSHRGQWTDIQGVTAREMLNSGGVFGRAYFGGFMASGRLGLSDNQYHDYLSRGQKLRYTTTTATFSVHNRVFGIGGNGWYLRQSKEFGGHLTANVRYQLGVHILHLGAGAQLSKLNTILSVTPRYELDNQYLIFTMGAEVARDEAVKKIRFVPVAEVRLHGVVSPFAKLTGELKDNTYRTLFEANPFFSPSYRYFETQGAARHHELRVGVAGRIGYVAAWNIWAGGEMHKNTLLISSSVPEFVDMEAVTAGAEVEVMTGYFVATVKGKYLKYKELNDYLPAYEGAVDVGYVRPKWGVHVGADLRGEYSFQGIADYPADAPTAVDLHAQIDYNVGRRVGLFVMGNNLLDNELYPQSYHKGFGISATAGIKVKL